MSRRSGQSGSIQQDGNWYVVRFWKDVEGQEKRQRVREKICPISGPGKLSGSERKRKAKEIIVASGADTVEHFEKVVQSLHGVTFRGQATKWLHEAKTRKRNPVAPSTSETWDCALEKWINPSIGDTPLESVNNFAMKELVAKMDAGGLAPKSIANYMQIVKMVVASVVDEQTGERCIPGSGILYSSMPRWWTKRNRRLPSFLARSLPGLSLSARSATARCSPFVQRPDYGWAKHLGIDIKDVSPDGSVIKIRQKAWKGQIHDYLKTINGEREVDLHSSVAKLVKKYVGIRQSGLLFCTRTGKQLSQSNILRRGLHPTLKELKWQDSESGIKQAGSHAFRRFRNTYLRNHTLTPDGVIKFWLGHANKTVTDDYSMLKEDVTFRKEVAEKVGIGFELPIQDAVVAPNAPKEVDQTSAESVT